MKKLLMALALTASSMAFADHSLKTAMDQGSAIRSAVTSAIKSKEVVCDLDHSLQMEPTMIGAAWRQVALCYGTAEELAAANKTLTTGNQFGGIYGLTVKAILDVEYSENAKTSKYDKVISISLK